MSTSIFMRYIFVFLSLISFTLNAQNSFSQGVKSMEEESFTEALLDFKKVSEEDDNYWKKLKKYIGDIYAQQEKWDEAVA